MSMFKSRRIDKWPEGEVSVDDILAVPTIYPSADLPRFREESMTPPLDFIGGYAVNESFFRQSHEGEATDPAEENE